MQTALSCAKMRDMRMGKKHEHLSQAGLDRLDQVRANRKKTCRLIFIHQMPLSQWEPKPMKKLMHFLTWMYKVTVQIKVNIDLYELSSTQS